MNYECHITVSTEYAEKAAEVARILHWKTSEIARDPVLGDKNFYYLTTHCGDFDAMFTRMRACVDSLESFSIPVIREKIELIIHDTKTNRFASPGTVTNAMGGTVTIRPTTNEVPIGSDRQ